MTPQSQSFRPDNPWSSSANTPASSPGGPPAHGRDTTAHREGRAPQESSHSAASTTAVSQADGDA